LQDPNAFRKFLQRITPKTACPAESQARRNWFPVWQPPLLTVRLGAVAFMGLGAYSYVSGHSQLKAQQAKILQSKSIFGIKSRQAGITGIAFTLAGMGFWRLVN
jgi:hypothetical protein